MRSSVTVGPSKKPEKKVGGRWVKIRGRKVAKAAVGPKGRPLGQGPIRGKPVPVEVRFLYGL